jgi:hypothetical protein
MGPKYNQEISDNIIRERNSDSYYYKTAESKIRKKSKNFNVLY